MAGFAGGPKGPLPAPKQKPTVASYDEWGTPYDAQGNSLAEPPMSWGEAALTGLGSAVNFPLAIIGALSPYGVEEGWRVPPAIQEPYAAWQRLGEGSGIGQDANGNWQWNIPSVEDAQNRQDVATVGLTFFGGNAFNPGAVLPGGAVGMFAGRKAKGGSALAAEQGRWSPEAMAERMRAKIGERKQPIVDDPDWLGKALSKDQEIYKQTIADFEKTIPISGPPSAYGKTNNAYRKVEAYTYQKPEELAQALRSAGIGSYWDRHQIGIIDPELARILPSDNPAHLRPDEVMTYHGTPGPAFTEIDPSMFQTRADYDAAENIGRGFFTTHDPYNAYGYSRYKKSQGTVLPVAVSTKGMTHWNDPKYWDAIQQLPPIKDQYTGETLFSDQKPSIFGGALAAEQSPQGITAYHGSPHDFDRFDMSKIGTGEGAQAYGHGLYFSEAENVAKWYRDNLAPRHNTRPFIADTGTGNPFDGTEMLEPDPTRPGHMYQVRINANPEDFLDWDKPLSQQSEKIRNAVQSLPRTELYTRKDGVTQPADLMDLEGDALYNAVAEALGRPYDPAKPRVSEWLNHPAASQALRDAGIPGIRYLDQVSRKEGIGSSNYSVFDDSLIEILKKYGLAGLSLYGLDSLQQQGEQ